MGTRIHAYAYKAALLKHGTYDLYCFPDTPAEARERFVESELYRSNRSRVHFISTANLGELQAISHIVLLGGSPAIHRLTPLRRDLGRPDCPIVGILYSLNYASMLEKVLLTLVAPTQSYDAIVCPGNAGASAFRKLIDVVESRLAPNALDGVRFRPRIPVVPYGIDTDIFTTTPLKLAAAAMLRYKLNISPATSVILYVGRLSAVSKADLAPLLIAFNQLSRASDPPHLIVAGDDHAFGLRDQLLLFAQELGCQDRVTILTNVSVELKHSLYAASDIFVSPSDSTQETFGLTVLEAMAASLPVVVSDWNGYRDIVRDDETGILVPTAYPVYHNFDEVCDSVLTPRSEDLLARTTIVDIPALIRALRRLCTDSSLRQRLGSAGRQRACSEYDHRSVVRQYENLFDELVDESRRGEIVGGVDFYTYPKQYVFSGYPTRVLHGELPFSLSAVGRQWAQSRRSLAPIHEGLPWCRQDILELLLAAAGDSPQTLESLIASCLNVMDQDLAQAHIARLMKYGLLEAGVNASESRNAVESASASSV